MRKLFSILSAVLVSLAMQATAVRQGINLSSATAYGTQGTDVNWDPSTKTVETKGNGNTWKGLHTAAALDATGYTELVLVLTSGYETVNVNLAVEYTGGTPATHNVSNTAGKNTLRLPLQATNISDIIIRVTNESSSAVIDALYLYKVIGKEDKTNLLNSDYELVDWNWNNRLQLSNTLFGAIHEGDKLVVTYTSQANADPDYVGAQVRIKDTNAEFTDVNESEIIQESQTNATFEIVIREADIEGLKTKGMYINGKKIVINKVDLYTYAQHVLVERTLNTGYKAVSWEGIFAHWDDIPTVYEGDELRATVVAKEGSDNQLYFRYDWVEGHELIPDEAVDGTTPKIYTRTLTAEDAAAINATHDLLITGTGLTVSRFAIAQSMSIYDANMLWRESTEVTTWDNPVSLSADKFANLTVGDVINVTLSSVTEGGQLWMTKSDASHFTPKPHYIFNSNWVAPLTISYVVNQEMLTDLQAGGLLICGANFTINSVHIIEAPARQESYELTVGEAGMATLVLPFNVPYLPDGVEAYTLTNNGTRDIFADQVNTIEADKPVLILAPAGNHIFYSELGANADISGKYAAVDGNYTNGALIGNYVQSAVPTTGPNTYNYILQNGSEGVGFYQVRDGSCSVAPYRAYLSCGYDATPSPGAPARAMRIVFRENTATGVDNIESAKMNGSAKFLRNGQLFILRNGVEYNANGALVK